MKATIGPLMSANEFMKVTAGMHLSLGRCENPKTCALCSDARRLRRLGVTDPAEIVERIAAERTAKGKS